MNDTITVLVVDDEQSIRALAREILEREGWSVRVAADGVEALELLGSGPKIDCVVSDVMMPRIGGVELLMKLHQARPELPAVLISGRIDLEASSMHALAPLLSSGARCLLKKPFSAELLVAAVQRALSHSCVEAA